MKSRVLWADIAGLPNGPGTSLVSAIRHGVTGINCRGVAPIPLNESVWGEPLAESVKLSVPVRGPDASGVNVAETVQLLNAATVLPQVVPLIVKSAGPDNDIEPMDKERALGLENVTICGVPSIPSASFVNTSPVGLIDGCGTATVPFRNMLCVNTF